MFDFMFDENFQRDGEKQAETKSLSIRVGGGRREFFMWVSDKLFKLLCRCDLWGIEESREGPKMWFLGKQKAHKVALFVDIEKVLSSKANAEPRLRVPPHSQESIRWAQSFSLS